MKLSELLFIGAVFEANSLSKTEYSSWHDWLAHLRSNFKGVWIDGDHKSTNIVQAMVGAKPYVKGKTLVVGEWSGSKGVIYNRAKELAQKFAADPENKGPSTKPDANGVIENPDPKSPLGMAKKMLGSPKIKRKSSLPDTDLHHAKRVGFEKVESAAGPWYLQLFTYLKNHFVQVQSPSKDVFYVQPVYEGKLSALALAEGSKYKALREPVTNETLSYNVTGWHATSVDNWASIKKSGLKPGMAEASGQPWDSKWKGKAVYYHLTFPSHEIDNCSFNGELHSVIIEARLHGYAGYFVPDEDVSEDVNYTPEAIKNGEAVAYGYVVPRSDFVCIHLPDVPESHEWAEANCKGFNVRFHEVS